MCIDAHIHLSLDGLQYRRRSRSEYIDHVTRTFREYKRRDIYILREGGDNLGFAPLARDIAERVGVIYKTPLYSFYKRGYYGSFTGKPVEGIEDFKEEFNKWWAMGPDHMKIILTGIVDFDVYGKVGDIAFSFEEVYYMIQAAKDKDLPVMVHANTAQGVRRAIKAGADTIEHGYFITDEELHMMADEDVVWVPTLTPLGNLIVNGDERFRDQLGNIEKIYHQHLANLQKAHKIGVKIAVGSDAGAYGVCHGQGFYDEIDHLVKAGITREKAFDMALDNGIKALCISSQELGAIIKKVGAC
jgi:hypothetical protein